MTDRLSAYGYSFQVKVITSVFTDKSFIQQIADILLPEYFESPAAQWIIKKSMEYFDKYKTSPTLDYMKVNLDTEENDILVSEIKTHLRDAWKYTESTDLTFVKEQTLDFCKNQEIKKAILNSVELLKSGHYDEIKNKIDTAMKAGADRDIGHDYMTAIDDRYLESVRDVVETPWDVINDLTDGGIGKGELGVMVAPAGIGKCVGPNTLIDIEYEQIGIEIVGQTGNQIVLWIDPWEEFQVDDDVILKGYQIEMILDAVTDIGKTT